MRQKALAWIGLSIGVIAIAIALFFILKGRNKPTSDALRTIPIDAAVIFKTNSFGNLSDALYKTNEFWEGVGSFNLVADANHFLEIAERLKEKSSTFSSLLFNNTLFMSAHPVGKGSAELFFATNLPEKIRPSDVKYLIDQELSENYKLDSKEYNGGVIYTYSHKNLYNI
jgi:CDP-diglyceride synthetase